MENSVTIILLSVATLIFIAALWRFASRRQSIPCPVWLHRFVEMDNPFIKTNRAAFIIDSLELAAGMTVLDAGCGPGRLTVPLARSVGPMGRVVAIDIQPGMLDLAKAKTEAAGFTNVEFVTAALGDGRLETDHFDCGVLVNVLGEIPNRESAFAELFAALKPGGVLAVVEAIFDPHFQSRKTVTELALAAGFRQGAFFGHKLAYVIHFAKPERV